MSVYLIAKITIHDRQKYAQYESGFGEIFARHEGQILSVDEDADVLEGSWPVTRTVLLQFPDKARALAWYRSDDYQALAQHRFSASEADIVMVESMS